MLMRQRDYSPTLTPRAFAMPMTAADAVHRCQMIARFYARADADSASRCRHDIDAAILMMMSFERRYGYDIC